MELWVVDSINVYEHDMGLYCNGREITEYDKEEAQIVAISDHLA